MNITHNIASAEAALHLVKDHCMCAKFTEDETHYTVIYPQGMCLDGARAAKAMGKAKALSRLLTVMERHWTES